MKRPALLDIAAARRLRAEQTRADLVARGLLRPAAPELEQRPRAAVHQRAAGLTLKGGRL